MWGGGGVAVLRMEKEKKMPSYINGHPDPTAGLVNV